MHIIIDGYNFIFKDGQIGRKDLQSAREGFCLRLEKYVQRKKVELEVVFDSSEDEYFPSVSSRKGVRIAFAPDADEYIRKTVRENHNPASILVVSSDGDIIRDARRMGARVKSTAEFDLLLKKGVGRASRLSQKIEMQDSEKPTPESMSEGELSAWLEEFARRRSER